MSPSPDATSCLPRGVEPPSVSLLHALGQRLRPDPRPESPHQLVEGLGVSLELEILAVVADGGHARARHRLGDVADAVVFRRTWRRGASRGKGALAPLEVAGAERAARLFGRLERGFSDLASVRVRQI